MAYGLFATPLLVTKLFRKLLNLWHQTLTIFSPTELSVDSLRRCLLRTQRRVLQEEAVVSKTRHGRTEPCIWRSLGMFHCLDRFGIRPEAHPSSDLRQIPVRG